jgi:hypothetical protein
MEYLPPVLSRMWRTRNKELKSEGKTKQSKEEKNQPRHKKERKEMRLERKTATETEEATQGINCEEQFHEDWGEEWVQGSCTEPEGPVGK